MGLKLRRVAVAIAGAWIAALSARVVFGDLVGLDGWVLGGLLIACALIGLGAGAIEARELRPMAPTEKRNSVLGWGFALSLVPVTACLYIEMPWGVLAAVGTALALGLLIGTLAGPPPAER